MVCSCVALPAVGISKVMAAYGIDRGPPDCWASNDRMVHDTRPNHTMRHHSPGVGLIQRGACSDQPLTKEQRPSGWPARLQQRVCRVQVDQQVPVHGRQRRRLAAAQRVPAVLHRVQQPRGHQVLHL